MAHHAETPIADAGGRGWAVFAGVMFLVAAASNLLYGISALATTTSPAR